MYKYRRDTVLGIPFLYTNGAIYILLALKFRNNNSIRLTDEQAKVIIELYSGCRNATEFQALKKAEQEKELR